MSDYSKSTNFAAKDALTTGDPNKVVKGTEIDDEFNAISSAIASKADEASPAFTGTPTAPTATAGANTTQVATTAFVTGAITTALATGLAAAYPVGSIYMNAGVSTNPATLLGFGTWTDFGAGRILVGLDSGDALFDTLEETGGSKDAVVVSHTHTATVTDPGHSHAVTNDFLNVVGSGSGEFAIRNSSQGLGEVGLITDSKTTSITVANSTTGSSGTNANLQPFIVVKMWKRTA